MNEYKGRTVKAIQATPDTVDELGAWLVAHDRHCEKDSAGTGKFAFRDEVGKRIPVVEGEWVVKPPQGDFFVMPDEAFRDWFIIES
ncbi:MAG: hypothetical protein ACI38R_11000 [Rhodococcus sp. (in: high G+C Gram-positive bacteria)]